MLGIPGEGMLAGKMAPEAPGIPDDNLSTGKIAPEMPGIPDEDGMLA